MKHTQGIAFAHFFKRYRNIGILQPECQD